MAKDIHNNLLFEGVNVQDIDAFLTSLPAPVHLKRGEFLWHQNDAGDSMYLLIHGRLDVLIRSGADDTERVIANIETGAVLGEVCVFGEKFRSASIRAAEDSELLTIDGKTFLQKVQNREIGALTMCYNVAKLLTRRLITANEFIRKIQLISEKSAVKSELEHYRQRFSHDSLFN